MEVAERIWFLLGLPKQGEKQLIAFAVGFSSQSPDLATEYEPRAVAVLKKQVEEFEKSYNLDEYRLHACRITCYRDERHKEALDRKERRRWHSEFHRFLSKSDFTLVEQNDVIRQFVTLLLDIWKEDKEKQREEMGIRPLSQSLWGKK